MLNEISHFNHHGKMWHVIEDAGMFYAHNFTTKTASYATQEALLQAVVSGSAEVALKGAKSSEAGDRVVLKKDKPAAKKPWRKGSPAKTKADKPDKDSDTE